MAAAQGREAEIAGWLADQYDAMLGLLETLVNTDSGSFNKAGVDQAGAHIASFLSGHDIATEVLPLADHGDGLRAQVPGGAGAGNRPVVLMGHRDTVFPKGEPERRPFAVRDGRAYGPGVADMKAGLVMNAFVLAAFKRFGGAPATLVGLFTGDEEIGSPSSRPLIEAEASRARCVFNSEPGRISGNVVTGRKGGIFLEARVTGTAAHSGANFSDGVSAIEELARKIQAWHRLTDLDRGITLNVGLVSGGQSVNTVAPDARCGIDVRYVSPGDRDEIMASIRNIAETCSLAGTTGSVEISGEFLPLNASPESAGLFDLYKASARDAGLTVDGEFSGGCADSGFAAAAGAPTLCGVGPVGAKVHSPDEFVELATLVPRAQALALAILRLGAA